jgi:parvulin-like peptidyl-prolyl isomerase
MSETANLHAEVEALREQLDYQNQQQQEQSHKQHQEYRQWIADNLEEAQRIIDNIVGIKGITEDPLKAAAAAGLFHNRH